MHLIFVRHGDPDYSIDSLTEKGIHEAELLNTRVKNWPIDRAFVSPLGRARKTAEIALDGTGIAAEEFPWLKEFSYPVKHPVTGKKHIPWDWLPEEFISEKKYFRKDKWFETKAMKSGNIKMHYREVCEGIDSVLAGFGYIRKSKDSFIYKCTPHMTVEEASVDHHLDQFQKNYDERNEVFFCHLGVMFTIISHLTGISPVQLWQGFFVAPSSVTVLGAEERVPGEVIFRIQSFGDIHHLLSENEKPSASGFFGNCFDL